MRFYRSEHSRRLMYRSHVGIRPWILLPVAGALIMAPLFLFFVATTTFDDQVVWTIFNARSFGLNIPQALWLGLVTFLLSSAVSFGLDWRQAVERKRPVAWLWTGLSIVLLGLAAAGYSLYLWTHDLRTSLLDEKGLTAESARELFEYTYFDRTERRFKVDEEHWWKDLPMLLDPTERSRRQSRHWPDWSSEPKLLKSKVAATERIMIVRFELKRAGEEWDLVVQPERWLKGEPEPGDGELPTTASLLGNGSQQSFDQADIENALGHSLEELTRHTYILFWSPAWEDRLCRATDENLERVERYLTP